MSLRLPEHHDDGAFVSGSDYATKHIVACAVSIVDGYDVDIKLMKDQGYLSGLHVHNVDQISGLYGLPDAEKLTPYWRL